MAEKDTYLERVKRVRRSLKADALLVSDITNIRYLTGFRGSSARLVIAGRSAYFLTDSRYTVQAAQEVVGPKIKICKKGFLEEVASLSKRLRLGTLGFDDNNVTHREWTALKKALKGVKLKPLAGLVEEGRMVKDASELESISRAIEIASKGFSAARRWVRPGTTEKHIVDMMERALKGAGSEGLAFDIIVASGERSALPHARPSDKKVRRGELVLVDMGATFAGYHSDESRTFCAGRPSRKESEIYSVVKEAHGRAIEAVGPGVKAKEVDLAARGFIKEAGYGDYFGHGTGHGVGLDIHEGPVIGPKSETVLTEGMVFTIEPGIYVPAVGGVRIEDMVLVTSTGSKLLTAGSSDLKIFL